MPISESELNNEWLEPDGRGGFASGTVSGIRTRRYHALLFHAATPPTGRQVLVNGFEAWVDTTQGSIPISAQRYQPDVVHPDGFARIVEFDLEPWPTWHYQIGSDVMLKQEILVSKDSAETLIRWSVPKGSGPMRLHVRPLLSGRDFHSLHRENAGVRFDAEVQDSSITWRPYPSVAGIRALTNGKYMHAPDWYRNFLYRDEQARGLDCVEDLASPGVFDWDLGAGEAILVLSAEVEAAALPQVATPLLYFARLEHGERRRRNELGSPIDRAADDYIVRRGTGKTIVAGYPWFTDWGRDTFIALRGLCIARHQLGTARDILLEWAGTVSEGMLPNLFPDGSATPEYNSVDASLWYIVAVHDLIEATSRVPGILSADQREKLQEACAAIVTGYARGTRFGIRMDSDGLLACGARGVQLTWMDAKIGDWVVTPRIGKPVEVQALWLNALRIVGQWSPAWKNQADLVAKSFRIRFWNDAAKCLFDVIDVDHVPGHIDASIRPNQIFAIGGLPYPMLDGTQAWQVLQVVEEKLLSPLGLRSLAPDEPGYRPHYEGGVYERDSAYHQGTVWPWLMGPFVEGWLHVHGNSPSNRREARRKFLAPLEEHLSSAGLGHVSEIVDGEPPHTPRGCPFQAWSLGEFLRTRLILNDPTAVEKAKRARAVHV